MKGYIRCVRLSGIKRPFLLFGTLVCLAALLVSPRMLAGDPQSAFDANSGQQDGLPPVYNPYPPGILPFDLNSRTSQGSGGGGFRRRASARAVAHLKAPDSDRPAPNTPEYGNCGSRNTGRTYELR
jgi:hypothetical protein